MAKRILALALALNVASASADELLVITGLDEPKANLNRKQLENIFLRKSLINNNGVGWIPLNLPPDNPLRVAFSETLLKLPPNILEAYWNEQYFNGISPPHVLASEEAVIRFVSTTPGAIGYILPCHLDKRVKVLVNLPTVHLLKNLCQ